jgi:uncharacterized membrane protein
MSQQVLYTGDTALKEAASYLAGIMHHYGIPFDYLSSDRKFDLSLIGDKCRILILSDYPAGNFRPGQLEEIAGRVEAGMGLLMIGGWESYTGMGGDYGKTAIGKILPVAMSDHDDRVNCPQPCLVERNATHPIVADLPFDEVAPAIGGYNRVVSRTGGQEILSARRFAASRKGSGFSISPVKEADPLLVTGSFGRGRITAFTSDAAPHWVGGLVDWGDARVVACAPGANTVEIGNWYARFFYQMIGWTCSESMP